MNPIRLSAEKTIILLEHVESVRIVEGNPIEQRDGTLMYAYSLNKSGYINALCHTPTAAIVRYTSGVVEVYGGADRDLIWAAFNKLVGIAAEQPECQTVHPCEQEGPPLTVLEGYGIKLEVKGVRPKPSIRPRPSITQWVSGCPTFRIVSQETTTARRDLPLKVLKLLQHGQHGWYLDYSIKVGEDDQLTLDDHQGLWLMTQDPESVIGNSTLLMAYTSYVEPL